MQGREACGTGYHLWARILIRILDLVHLPASRVKPRMHDIDSEMNPLTAHAAEVTWEKIKAMFIYGVIGILAIHSQETYVLIWGMSVDFARCYRRRYCRSAISLYLMRVLHRESVTGNVVGPIPPVRTNMNSISAFVYTCLWHGWRKTE